MNWIIMPYRGNLEQTADAVGDALDQSIDDPHLLLIQQGGEAVPLLPPRDHSRRLHRWHHDPPLPSLAATWNRALQMVWEMGMEHALVVNNDVRLPRRLYAELLRGQRLTRAWFITACNVGESYHEAGRDSYTDAVFDARGGPDFSCFLITKDCHTQFPFDEGFQPAYCEDLDYHRRLMLAGRGDRIFSVPVPYFHYASGTLKSLPEAARQQLGAQIGVGSRAYYARKWGGPPNQEAYALPFDPASARAGVTTPDLQHRGIPT